MNTTVARHQLLQGRECAFMVDLILALPLTFGDSESRFIPQHTDACGLTVFLVNYFPSFIEKRACTYAAQADIRRRWNDLIEEYSRRSLGGIHENVRTLYAMFLEIAVHEWTNVWSNESTTDLTSMHVEALQQSIIDQMVARGGWMDPHTLRAFKQNPVCHWKQWAEELSLILVQPVGQGGIKRNPTFMDDSATKKPRFV